jgi:hypothetical protein
LFRELEALGFALAGLLQWALRGIDVLVAGQPADRASRACGGIDLPLLPQQESPRLPSFVLHAYLLASMF